MKIMVTGGAGFIGSNIVDGYVRQGHQVVVVDNLATGRVSNLNPNVKFYQMDIRSEQLAKVFEQEQPEVVNHHAAQMDVRRSVADPLYDADVNVKGAVNVLENARKFNVQQVIYSSSGGTVYGEPEYFPCDENHPIRPICQYGGTKYMMELYLYMYRHMYGLNYTIFRYPNVYGPRQDPKGEAGVVAIFTGQMVRGEQVIIHGDGEQERDFVFVEDVAAANVLALGNRAGGHVYNLGAGEPTSVNQIFQALQQVTGYDRAPQYDPARLGETRKIYLDANKARRELGWSPATDLITGMRRTVDYYKETELVL
jgi:UDP-glucose 4-epimerase